MAQGNDSVRVVVYDEERPDLFLIVTEVDDPENWKLPGGRFDFEDEKPADAAQREIEEELGMAEVDLEVCSQLVNDDGVSNRFIFKLTVEQSRVVPSPEIAQIRWVKAEQVPEGKNHSHILSAVAAAA